MNKNVLPPISIVVPAYNEGCGIGNTLDCLTKIKDLPEFEIIVVDDGSNDNTFSISESFNVKIIHHEKNRGYGAALKSGIKCSKYNWVLITDADGTYPIEELVSSLEDLEKYDMIVGARIGKKVKIPVIRKPAKWFINQLANYLSEYKIPDLNSGLRIFRKSEVMRFFNILPNGFSFTSTITLAMLTNDMLVKFVPINYLKREGKSKIKPIKDTLTFLQLIVRTVMYFNPLKIFIPISLFLFLTGILVLLYSIFFTEKIMDTTVVILVVSSIQTMAIGMIADLIDKRSRL